MNKRWWIAGLLSVTLGLGGCASPLTGPDTVVDTPSPTVSVMTSPAAQPTAENSATGDSATPCLSDAQQLSLAQQVGQLYMTVLMADADLNQATAAIRASRNGAVILLGNRNAGLDAVLMETQRLQESAPGVPLLIATDQEGGQVQKLTGPGFDSIPSATGQAELTGAELRDSWQRWGNQLHAAGVNWNLAPVADVVPQGQASDNAAIGQLDRGYGSDPLVVAERVTEVIGGLSDSGVASAAKHFPGLGNVKENTDFAVGHDSTSLLTSDDLISFQAAIDAGASSVMVSSAVYDQVDPDNPAVFSPTIMTGILRDTMGFDGLVISDDLGAAQAVAAYPVADRGLLFLKAGGDMAVVADASAAQQMADATVAAAEADPQFAAEITAKAARILDLKSDLGLMSCSVSG